MGSMGDAKSAAWANPAGPTMNNALKIGASLMHACCQNKPFLWALRQQCSNQSEADGMQVLLKVWQNLDMSHCH